MITINSNASATMAQNNLFKSQAALTGNMQQLSTGLRINSASDDAAGLQISNRMETQMNGLGVAQRNANDAISLAQTAEGAMTENTTILNRMRDLSLQAVNDTNTENDRASMQKEVAALITEVDRISEHTNFAGINLLNGDAKDMSFQIGSDAGQTVGLTIAAMGADDLAGTVYEVDISNLLEFDDNGLVGTDPAGPVVLSFVGADEDGSAEMTISLDAGSSRAEVIDAINNQISGISAYSADGDITLTGSGLSGFKEIHVGDPDNNKSVIEGRSETVANIDLEEKGGAELAIQILDDALTQVDNERANLGAFQNRLESTISNLSNIEENLGVAQSRIQDADFASQTVEMTSNQMLMQAGTSVLAQAKGMPQYATMLL